ncbi:cadherin-like domain-containing protein [Aureispira sp. CCB-E]|uniref:cadherin-like domain-containing protein n=3 Tax=unclassified Aureispira TaxID=2649989 RepID=UPI00286852C6|nr:Ig-like domain-containing protein [Aureispira sp. CCB-E]WMX14574.1 Ig-like domain-containing protein [Aureispira sp. CCB-E]
MQTQLHFVQRHCRCLELLWVISLFLLGTTQLNAEGTAQVMPNAGNGTALVVSPNLTIGTYRAAPADNRLKISILNHTIENIYFGLNPFQRVGGAGPSTNGFYRILDPTGAEVVPATPIPTAGTGFIPNYAQAVAGPNIGGLNPTGYTPILFNPTQNGDYVIELYRSNDAGVSASNDEIFFPFFDFTVGETNNTTYRGRLNCQQWGFITYNPLSANFTPAINFSFEGDYYAYTEDSSVVRMNFEPGFQPFRYVLAMNKPGVTNGGNFLTDRISTYTGANAPTLPTGYPIFLSIPDTNIFKVAPPSNAPAIPSNVYGCPGDYFIPLFIPDPGDVAILLDLNGVVGYQAGTSDRVLELYDLVAGNHVLSWDGLDGQGNPVAGNVNFLVTATLFRGRTNIPMHDAELNGNGFSVTAFFPALGPRKLYWDDTNLGNVGNCSVNATHNTTGAGVATTNMLEGVFGPAHAWDGSATFAIPAPTAGRGSTTAALCDDFGNARTINTWFWSYDVSSAPFPRTTPDCDQDGDGIADNIDIDDDNDGIPDLVEHPTDPLLDADGDGIPNYLDPDFPGFVDANMDGVNDNFDADGDAVINSYDLDSDNDGISDIVEAGGVDTDGNGLVDGTTDADNDGLIDLYDSSVAGTTNVTNTSADDCQTVVSPAHTISFASGTTDAVGNVTLSFSVFGAYGFNGAEFTLTGEGGVNLGTFNRTNSDNSAYADCSNPPMNFSVVISQANWNLWNNDGTVVIDFQADADVDPNFCATASSCISNVEANYQIPGVGSAGNDIAVTNTDGDLLPDYLDLDADNDGIPDIVEAGGTDVNGDGRIDNYTDTDGDGWNDVVDGDVGNDGTSENLVDVLIITNSDGNSDGIPDSYPNNDTDRDGILDHLDLDADNDGIPDVVEAGGTDENGDGRVDNYVDVDNDGYNDVVDGDVGNDGIPENSADALQLTEADGNGDGRADSYPEGDTDRDGILDQLDLDADNDGIPDVVEAGGTDVNGDGRADGYIDNDRDGYNDVVDGDPTNALAVGTDTNGANTSNALQLTGEDTNGDGTPEDYPTGDTDGDGILDQLDLDADNDGIPDVVEVGGTDANGDGRADGYIDNDRDGYNDVVDGDPTNALALGTDTNGANTSDALLLTGADTDGDGNPNSMPNGDLDGDNVYNHLDLDADNDGILDIEEAGGTDANRDGQEDAYADADGDGFNDVVDGDPTNALAVGTDTNGANSANATTRTGADTDGDGAPNSYPNDNQDGDNNYNFLDIDADNDGIVDNTEGQATSAYIAPDNNDTDGDGIDDAYDSNDAIFGGAGSGIIPNNQDGAADNPDYLDLDTDNDGIPDVIEGHDTNGDGVVNGADSPNANTGLSGGTADVDGDGLLDGYDNNTANTNATNIGLNPNSHPDAKNEITVERDWREGNTTYATNDINTTPTNVTIVGNVLTNDYDQEEDNQTLTGVEIDANGDGTPETVIGLGVGTTVGGINEDGTPNANAGTLTQNANGTYTFVPTTGFVGEVTYLYDICDNGQPQACTEAKVTIDVEPAPTTDNGELALAPDVNTTYDNIAVNGQVLSNDNDPDGDNILVTGNIQTDTDGDGVVDATVGLSTLTTIGGIDKNGNPVTNAGTLVQNANGTYTFNPVAGFIGVVEYIYTACDDGAPITCEQTTVTIDVLPRLYNSTNAIDDEEFVDKGTTLNDNVLTNDTDVEGDNQVGGVSLVTGPTNGSLTLNPDGTYSYTPTNPNFSGNDEFVYSVCDNGSPQVCDTATVYITILDVNKDYGDAPAIYGEVYHRAIRDANSDNVLDGTTDVWLGTNTDFENNALGVNGDSFDDGMELGTNTPGAFPRTVMPSTVYNVDLDLNSVVADNVSYGMWIDWNADGVYDDFYSGTVAVPGGPFTTTVVVTSPASVATNLVNIRIRLDDNPLGAVDFQGARTNGEVEDYQFLMNDPLPVELLYFTAKLEGKNTGVLNWATSSELNNAGYEVEHALPSTGAPEFNQIGYVNGAGTTTTAQNYDYKVPNLISGVHYFRLKQVDFDGTSTYTEVRSLTVEAPLVKQLFPTVLHEGSSTVYLQISKDDRYQIEVITALGQIVESYSAPMTSNAYHEIDFDMNRYVSGIYFIRVSSNNTSFTRKIRVE